MRARKKTAAKKTEPLSTPADEPQVTMTSDVEQEQFSLAPSEINAWVNFMAHITGTLTHAASLADDKIALLRMRIRPEVKVVDSYRKVLQALTRELQKCRRFPPDQSWSFNEDVPSLEHAIALLRSDAENARISEIARIAAGGGDA